MTPRVITFHYTMTAEDGQEIYSSVGSEPLAILEGQGQVIPGLEPVLSEMGEGEKRRVVVPAEEGFGEYHDDWVIQVSREQLPPGELNIGDMFQAAEDAPVMVVTEIDGDTVVMDGNHPLAGQDLTFDVEVLGFREATPEEIAHGHAHGEGGHHHH
ncbi:MAG: FKBP-type peptidyl-prolyl cis-trans isomerase [Chlorobi bacterium]|nr:MAG: FKBP-type peptidyl-prolyl cis-trans isomerase 2 [Chlorobi bacterium OLB7]MBK8911250.1 FKBP-type peptidyl-prolyl cis-trans isomerase [Chlorobiota bacterium]MBX7217988.1 FKBP-type peptidyl-prolyl cis-trans isomerase [Candidatus Kapabacteria bacterium]MCE7935941.1 peptidylprolyl isomerase [Chlorobi bacterium CHB2]